MNAMLKEALLRSWLVFVIVSLLAGCAMLLADHDNPLESDDPYLAGFVIGGISAVIMFVSSLTGGSTNRSANFWFFAILTAWCIFLLIVEIIASGEGDGILALIAAASFVIGSVCWFVVGAISKIQYSRSAVIISRSWALSCSACTASFTTSTPSAGSR